MKISKPIDCGQYAYTSDGRVVLIEEIIEKGKKFRGFDIKEDDHSLVTLDRSEIYGVAFRLGRTG